MPQSRQVLRIAVTTLCGVIAGCILLSSLGSIGERPQRTRRASTAEANSKEAAAHGNFAKEHESTVVTAYFEIPNKRSSDIYTEEWIPQMLKIEDAMVIFTSPDKVPFMEEHRSHAPDRTLIVPVDFRDLEVFPNHRFDEEFWEEQHRMDPHKGVVPGHELYKIWLAKSNLVKRAIEIDPFGSSIYAWSDIGVFRGPKEDFAGRRMISRPDAVPEDRVLILGTKFYRTRPRVVGHAPYVHRRNLYISGGGIAARKHTWDRWMEEFEETALRYAEKNLGLHDDQTIMLSTCLRVPDLCAIVPPDLELGEADHSKEDPSVLVNYRTFHGGHSLSYYGGGSMFCFKYVLYHGIKNPNDLWWPGKDGEKESIPLVDQQ